jgi:hypothetical protein
MPSGIAQMLNNRLRLQALQRQCEFSAAAEAGTSRATCGIAKAMP